ncbi:MAG TPA: SDR family NAD(P)-dependent oxidoreductase [Lentisphaeria bacterium]|nr:SDR family NAD(P)-dependent oxidoreductase [Lentisphaeria bacterium]
MDAELKNQVAVITGASQGIGQACAVAFAHAGADVAFTYGQNHEAAEHTAALVRDAGPKVFFAAADAADPVATEAFMRDVMDTFGQVDILVNNVGGADATPNTGFADMPMDYWHRQFAKNFFSAVSYSRLALRSMVPRRCGSIINIGSVHTSRVINLDVMPYACAKQALNHLTRCLAVEMAPRAIRVNCIAPGLIKTALTENRYNQDWWDKVFAKIPMARAGSAAEVAELALFLASARSSYITGQIIGIDGGRTLQ